MKLSRKKHLEDKTNSLNMSRESQKEITHWKDSPNEIYRVFSQGKHKPTDLINRVGQVTAILLRDKNSFFEVDNQIRVFENKLWGHSIYDLKQGDWVLVHANEMRPNRHGKIVNKFYGLKAKFLGDFPEACSNQFERTNKTLNNLGYSTASQFLHEPSQKSERFNNKKRVREEDFISSLPEACHHHAESIKCVSHLQDKSSSSEAFLKETNIQSAEQKRHKIEEKTGWPRTVNKQGQTFNFETVSSFVCNWVSTYLHGCIKSILCTCVCVKYILCALLCHALY